MNRPLLACLGALCALLAWTARASACATCGCGDPTLTTMGTEPPFANRTRFSLTSAWRTESTGRAGVDLYALEELRTTLSAAWAPSDRVMLSLTAPLTYRVGTSVNLARDTAFGPGDVELRARFVLLRDADFAPAHTLGVVTGLELPTAARVTGGNGLPLSHDVQPGSQSLDAILGVYYAFNQDPWAVWASATWTLPAVVLTDLQPGPSMRTSLALQWMPLYELAFRLALDTSLDIAARESGSWLVDSGGFTASLSPDVIVQFVPDWLLVVGVRAPVVQALRGTHVEGVTAIASLVVDVSL